MVSADEMADGVMKGKMGPMGGYGGYPGMGHPGMYGGHPAMYGGYGAGAHLDTVTPFTGMHENVKV